MNRVKASSLLKPLGVLLALVLSLIFTSVALAALNGPVTSPPGGVTITPSDPSGRQIGLAGGINYVFSGFQLDQFETLYWGGPQGNGAAGFAFDGALDEGGEMMSFVPAQSDLANGMARWIGQSDLTWWAGSQWVTYYYPTRFTLSVTDSAGSPVPMAIASDVGIPAYGPVITVTGIFTANLLMEVQYGSWLPCLQVFNGLQTDPAMGGHVLSEFWGQFYYTTASNATIAKDVTPSWAAPGDPITYTLSFSNTGTDVLSGLVITDIVPVSITVQSVISSGVEITNTGAPTAYVWAVADLGIGESGVITIAGILNTPLAAGTFTNTAIITTTDDANGSDNSSSIPVTVMNVAPVAVTDIYTAVEDIVLTVPAATGLLSNDSDANGGPLAAELLTVPATGSAEVEASGAYTYTPELNFNGAVTFTYRVEDSGGLADSAPVYILVEPANDPPYFSSTPLLTATQDISYSYAIVTADPDLPEGDLLTITAPVLPAWLALLDHGDGTAALAGTPADSDVGDHSVTLQVADTGGLTATQSFTISVANANDAPVLDPIGDQVVDEGLLLSFTVTATDIDPDDLVYSLDTGAPPGTSIDPATGEFTWTPTEVQGPGVYTVTVRVTDDGTPPLDDYETIQITVNEVNQAPVLEPIGAKSVDEGVLLPFTAVATDADLPPNGLTFSLDAGAPPGAGIGPATGEFTWTPTEVQGPGVYTVTVRVTDDGTPPLDDYETIQITVAEVNLPPIAEDDSYSTPEETPLVVDAPGVLGNDADADLPANPFAAALEDGPATGSLDLSLDGSFVYAPAPDYNGAITFTYRVSDSVAFSGVAVVTIDVTPVCDHAVQLKPAAATQTGDIGTIVTYTLRVTNSGECADILNVSIAAVWPTDVPATVGPLAAGAAVDVIVTVAIPVGADPGDQDVATITFASQGDGGISTASVLTTTATMPIYSIYLPVVMRSVTVGDWMRGETGGMAIYPQ